MYHPQTTEAPWKDSRNGFLSKSVAQVYPNYPSPGPKKKRAKRWGSIKRPIRDGIPSIWADHFKHFRLPKRNTTQVTKRYLSSGEKICDSPFFPHLQWVMTSKKLSSWMNIVFSIDKFLPRLLFDPREKLFLAPLTIESANQSNGRWISNSHFNHNLYWTRTLSFKRFWLRNSIQHLNCSQIN